MAVHPALTLQYLSKHKSWIFSSLKINNWICFYTWKCTSHVVGEHISSQQLLYSHSKQSTWHLQKRLYKEALYLRTLLRSLGMFKRTRNPLQ